MSENNGRPPTADQMIDAAIKATDAPAQVEVPVKQFQVIISSTGRPAAVILPADASDAEIAEFTGWVLTAVLGNYRAERAKNPTSRLVLPSTARVT